jgi:hypothetical protein
MTLFCIMLRSTPGADAVSSHFAFIILGRSKMTAGAIEPQVTAISMDVQLREMLKANAAHRIVEW